MIFHNTIEWVKKTLSFKIDNLLNRSRLHWKCKGSYCLSAIFLTISLKGPCKSVKAKGQTFHHDLLSLLKTE